MRAAERDCFIDVANMARDVRDTVITLRLALQGDATGFSAEMVAAVCHVAGWAERQAEEAVELSDRALARLEGRADG